MKKNKKVIYTCITGGYDSIPVHGYVASDWDYILFTDNSKLISLGRFAHWTVKPLQFNKLTNVKNARWHKVNAHKLFPDYNCSLWIDAQIIVNNNNLINLCDDLFSRNVLCATPAHPVRKCIYDEAVVIKEHNIDFANIVNSEVRYLRAHRYPANQGLSETNIVFRQHNKIKSALRLWWRMIKKFSKRDQLSFNYAIWKTNTPLLYIMTDSETGLGYHHYIADITFVDNKTHNRYRMLNQDRCRTGLCQWYQNVTGKYLNLNNPRTFNEKIQWSKIYDSRPIKTKLADKFLVRKWVAKKIGQQYLIPLLGVYDSFDEIDFDNLPNQFVIKCNHGAGYNIVVHDKSKLDLNDAKQKINTWLSEDFAFKNGFELHYSNIKRKIIIERFISNKSGADLNDYKFYCFNGRVKYIQVISERTADNHKVCFYDTHWKKQDWWDNNRHDGDIVKPKQLNKMLKLANKLCQGFNFVRVDLYYLDTDEIYFGEMTFTPSSGTMIWSSETINLYLGELFKLPIREYNIETDNYRIAKRDKKFNLHIPIIYYSRCDNKTKINILGAQVLKIKRTDIDYVVYVFGIQVFKRHISCCFAKINLFGIRVCKYRI